MTFVFEGIFPASPGPGVYVITRAFLWWYRTQINEKTAAETVAGTIEVSRFAQMDVVQRAEKNAGLPVSIEIHNEAGRQVEGRGGE